ncbi:MAG: glycosyltransferase [Cytophagales bacterium]
MHKVSIVIPLFNRKHLIGKTLDSLNKDLHPNTDLEIIVVDDGSTDGGDDFVEQNYPHVILLRQKNQGAPVARNLGLKQASGDFLLWLDSDDLIEPDFFRPKIAVFQQFPEVSGVYGLWEHFEEMEDGTFKIEPRHSDYPVIELPETIQHLINLLSGWYVIPHAILWKTDVMKNVGGFLEGLSINQDVELMFKTLLNGLTIVSKPRLPKALYRNHSQDSLGKINSAEKINDLYVLRLRFVEDLKSKGLWDNEMQFALAKYAFGIWMNYRKSFPKQAEEFYRLSRELGYKKIKNGSRFDETISGFIGTKRTILIKDFLKKIKEK